MITASTRMTPTNHEAARSAASAICGRVACARSSSRTIDASVESSTVAVAVSVSGEPRFTLPPRIRSPAPRRTAADSPVISDSSSEA